ncbi:hypothetical protein BOX15_Mlig010600g1 [Macrostomum lignano]|uniref:Uncharacterized protein n=1 Tax=Macrostomum lignano TaxID=282301 RepID=A0A267FGN8_9PLAT|nr:hypothetical protein BOX15_Mlig010600g1 [Macrostomum lignano]
MQAILKALASVLMQAAGEPLCSPSDEEFVMAIRNGDTVIVGAYLRSGRDLNREFKCGYTVSCPVHLACKTGKLAVVKMLLDARADVNFLNRNGGTALFVASQHGRDELVDLLIASGALVDAEVMKGCTSLYIAAQQGHQGVALRLIKAGAHLDVQMGTGMTPLYIASQNGHHDVVGLLISAQANVDLQQSSGAAPLHIAAQCGHLTVVEQLIRANANVDLREGSGGTPLFVASQRGHREVVDALLRAGANPDVPMEGGVTPLFIAAQFAHQGVVSSLIASRADVNRAKCTGATPLYLVAQNGQTQLVNTFIKASADVNLQQSAGMTPLFVASQNGYHNVASILIRSQADMDIQQNLGATSLYIASQNGHQQVVDLLIGAQADLDLQVKNEMSPLHVASQNRLLSIVRALLKARADVNFNGMGGSRATAYALDDDDTQVLDLLMQAQVDISPLLILAASLSGYQKSVDMLIKFPVDVDVELERGVSSLFLASLNGHYPVVESLIKAQTNFNEQQTSGLTPLSAAEQNGHFKVAALLKTALRNQDWLDAESDGAEPDSVANIKCINATHELDHPTASGDSKLSCLLQNELTTSGFVQSRAAIQSAVADVLQAIVRKRLDNDDVHIVGSYSEGWGNNLKTLDGRTDVESDIDVMRLIASRLYHVKGMCKCDSLPEELVEYDNGHIFCPGYASTPAHAFRGSALKPAVDKVDACRLCCYPPIAPLEPHRLSKSNIPKSTLQSLQNELVSSPCHVVHAAPPGEGGKQLRVSTTFLERRLLRSLNTLQGQLFVTLKYLVKKVISNKHCFKVQGVKSYHVKTITFRMIEEITAEQWKQENLVFLVRQALCILQDSLESGCRPGNTDHRIMDHFFLGDAGLYLKGTGPISSQAMKRILQEAAGAVGQVIDQLPKLLLDFKDTLRPVADSARFYFHPFAILPQFAKRTQSLRAIASSNIMRSTTACATVFCSCAVRTVVSREWNVWRS